VVHHLRELWEQTLSLRHQDGLPSPDIGTSSISFNLLTRRSDGEPLVKLDGILGRSLYASDPNVAMIAYAVFPVNRGRDGSASSILR